MQPHLLEVQTKLNASLKEVFEFFSRAENLNQVTPPELRFKILTPLPLEMKVGTLIDYQIRLSGIPFHWRTLITTWEPPYRFVDEQMKGPYKMWHHEHTFEQRDDHVLMTDRVHFLSPGGIFEPFINHILVEPKIKGIFSYREERFKDIFAGAQ
jgi:ligand-binding SRPBCC domain-containing protein